MHPREGFQANEKEKKKRRKNTTTDNELVKHSRASRQAPEGCKHTAPRSLAGTSLPGRLAEERLRAGLPPAAPART